MSPITWSNVLGYVAPLTITQRRGLDLQPGDIINYAPFPARMTIKSINPAYDNRPWHPQTRWARLTTGENMPIKDNELYPVQDQ